MTDKDREHFDNIMVELKKKIKDSTLSLEERVENLEIFMFWSLICDANEQGVTSEQKEMIKILGWDKIFAKALGLPWKQLFPN